MNDKTSKLRPARPGRSDNLREAASRPSSVERGTAKPAPSRDEPVPDEVERSSLDSFPASDPPGWIA